jgi:hypothetical protein
VLGTAARATEPIHRSTQRPPSPHATVRYFVCAVHTWQLMARNSLFRRHNGQTARAYACWKMLPKLLAGAHHRIVLPAINTRTLTTHRRRMLSDALSLHIHTYTHTHIHTYTHTYIHTYIQYCHRPPDEPSIQQALCIAQRMCLPGPPCSRARILEARKVSGSSPRPRHPAPVPNLPRYSRIALSLASSRLLLRYNLMATKPK